MGRHILNGIGGRCKTKAAPDFDQGGIACEGCGMAATVLVDVTVAA
jgi:hypothetical protein